MAYLDHAATTPMLPEALAAYVATATELGNASSPHAFGRGARRRVEEAREAVAEALGASPYEVVFTAGGTESTNLSVKGVFWSRCATEARHNQIITTAVEHHAVFDAVGWLERHEGAEIIRLPVDPAGRVAPEDLRAALDRSLDGAGGTRASLVSTMWANNEVGTVQPLAELAAIAARAGVPLHTDAVQVVGQLPVDFAASGVAAMSVSGHKIGGPGGVGTLLLTRDTPCTPLLHGGGQEREIRSGTLDVAGIVAFSVAVRAAVGAQAGHAARIGALRDELVARVLAAVPDAVLNGSRVHRLPGNAHFSFPGCEGDALLLLLDAQQIACSTGSACSAGIAQPSHVLLAMGADAASARSSLRFTLGHTSTRADVDALIEALPGAVERARRAGRGIRSIP
ncbi:MAG: cysteine desulfurase [Dactylosporangium sp.]|nr:cysteine desulfurase [Dactylosporangium sp.]NNJ59455.1 cysteine desulfurase [Dactylosporangium sp.]